MKIAFVVNQAAAFISHRMPIAEALIERGHEVYLLAPEDKEKFNFLVSKKITAIPIELSRKGKNPCEELRTLISIYRQLKSIKPDIIHAVTIKPVMYTGMLSYIMPSVHIVFAISGLGYTFIQQSLYARIMRAFISTLYFVALHAPKSKAIFQNHDDLELFVAKGLVRKKHALLIKGTGIDLAQYPLKKESKGKLRVVFASRLLKDKGILEFLDATAIVTKKYDVEFLVGGEVDPDNPASLSLEECNKLKLTFPYIQWLGHVSDVRKLFQESHIVVLPSYREGFPRVLLEAAASSRAIITTDVPGCRECITHMKTGLITKVQSSKDLANAMVTLITDPNTRITLSKAARSMVEEEYTVSHITSKTFDVYESLTLQAI